MLETASVAMAAYNGERYLPIQIESILAQLLDRDELVISYDESTDATLEVISSYAASDSRVKVVPNSRPGIVGNFNNALSATTKDVVFISDQDDEWVEGKRETVMRRLNETGADLLIHNVVHVDGNGIVISESLFEMYGIGPGLLRNFAKPRYSGCCMAFPARTKGMILPMPESVSNYDHWIGMACETFGKVDFCDDVLLHHRLHGANVTTSTRPLPIVLRQRANLLRELSARRRAMRR